MEILHGINLRLGAGQSLCLIGPNGAGKSTVLHSIYGFTSISGGSIKIGERERHAPGAERQAEAGGHRLHPAGQLRLPGHDRRGKSVDGRLSHGPASRRQRRRRSRAGRATRVWPSAAASRPACSPAASAACSRSPAPSS